MMAKYRLVSILLNARLCDISCIARKMFWFAVPPTMYAVARNFHDSIGLLRSAIAHVNCINRTANTAYFVRGSMPHNFETLKSKLVHMPRKLCQTSGWTFIMACRRVLCGSSVYDHCESY